MIQAALDGLMALLTWKSIAYLLLGNIIGVFFGFVPGIGGINALALLIPFVYGWDPGPAFALLLGTHASANFGGSITAVLFNIPGDSTNIATIFDGYPLTQKGQGARALGASAAASALGGLFGVLVLVASLPVLQRIVLLFGPPELFMLALLGISMIALLSGKSVFKGLVAGGLGILLSFVGLDPVTSAPRYTLGTLYLWDGLGLIPVVVGMFAIGEVIMLYVDEESICKREAVTNVSTAWQGVRDTLRHWSLVLRCSAIGALIGATPGVGGTVANIVAYGHSVQTSRRPETFGTGEIAGVIGPQSAANAKEGGALIPTVAFGVPGSEAMAILLGALMMLGLDPGPNMLTTQLNVTFIMVWTVALSILLPCIVGALLAGRLTRITTLPGSVLVPFVLVASLVAAYAEQYRMADVLVAVIFGLFGYLMRKHGFSQATLVVGLVLGTLAERYLNLALQAYGPLFLLRPLTLILLTAVVAAVILPVAMVRRRTSGRGEAA